MGRRYPFGVSIIGVHLGRPAISSCPSESEMPQMKPRLGYVYPFETSCWPSGMYTLGLNMGDVHENHRSGIYV